MPASTKDEHGCDNEETDHRVVEKERIHAERAENSRGYRWKALKTDKPETLRSVS